MKTIIYKGLIREGLRGENDSALFIGDAEEPIAQEFYSDLQGKQVSVRYWISDTKKTKEELQEGFLKTLFGAVDADYGDAYSEITGYLWTDEELNIGGHDLVSELRNYINKFVYMEIEIFNP